MVNDFLSPAWLCRKFGHRWRDCSSRQYHDGKDVKELARTCQRCGAFEVIGYEPLKEKGVTKR